MTTDAAIYIAHDPLRVTLHPEARVTDLGPDKDGVHDYEVRLPWGNGLIVWCAREPQDICTAVRAVLAEAAE